MVQAAADLPTAKRDRANARAILDGWAAQRLVEISIFRLSAREKNGSVAGSL